MKRGWFTERDQASEFSEGSEASRAKGLVLAEIADADFIDSIIRAKSAMDTFGGKLFIGAERQRFNRAGEVVSHNAPGQYITTAYVCHYDHEPMKGVQEEPDLNYPEVAALYRSELQQAPEAPEASGNGPVPAPVGAGEPDADSD